MRASFDLDAFYDEYPRIEEQFEAELDQSMHPRNPDLLYDLVASFQLPETATVVDVGCGEGGHTIQLTEQFPFTVLGIDPVERHIEIARSEANPRVSFSVGDAAHLPVEDGSVDLIWCRDVLVHVPDLGAAYAEFRRVLREGRRALVYQMFGTGLLEPREAEWLFTVMGVVPSNADPAHTEQAVARAGLRIEECIDLGSEWGEYAEEERGVVGRKLLHLARLQRDRERFVAQFGQAMYDIARGDCLWHVYRMLGKLSSRVYVLTH